MSASDTGGRLTASVSATRREGLVDAGFDLIRAKDPFTIVIFGASGDLARRKLIPALFHLKAVGLPAGALRRHRVLAHADDERGLSRRDAQSARRGGE